MVDTTAAPATTQPVNTQGIPISQASGSIVPSSPSALIVTSDASRAVTSQNVSKLQTATSGLIPTQTDEQRNAAMNDAGLTADQKTNVASGTPSTGADANGTAAKTNPDGTPVADNATVAAGIKDPAIAAQFKSSLDNLDSSVAQAKSNLDAAAATLQNDPAAAAAVQSIKDLYDKKIQLMKDKNSQLIGRANTSVAAFGGLGVMSQDFLNEEQSRADGRINDLVAQEQNLILKAQIAYKSNNLKAFNSAMAEYDKANTNKLNEINKLLAETHKEVSEAQAQQRLDMATQKASLSADISKSANVSGVIAKQIADSGITDEGQISDYVDSLAKEYGISNPDILKSAVLKAQQANSKADLAAKNTQSIIDKRNQPKTPKGPGSKSGVDGGYTYTPEDVAKYTSLLNKGGADASGNKYAKRGADGYVDPGSYIAAFQDWIGHNGTPAGFVKKFPVSNVNPASHALLPEAIRPKVKPVAGTNPPA